MADTNELVTVVADLKDKIAATAAENAALKDQNASLAASRAEDQQRLDTAVSDLRSLAQSLSPASGSA